MLSKYLPNYLYKSDLGHLRMSLGGVLLCIHNIQLYAVRNTWQLKSPSAPWLLEISSSAHPLLDSSLHTHVLLISPVKWSKNGTHIFEHPPHPNEMCGLGNDCPAASRCGIQTLPHVWDCVSEKILDYPGHFYGPWENHNTIVKLGTAKGIQVE